MSSWYNSLILSISELYCRYTCSVNESSVRPTGRREPQAAETRALILGAARKLFASRGYGATSIAQIAHDAGVAVPTIYKSIGTKLALLAALNELAAADADVARLVPRMRSTQDPAELIALQVELSRGLNERAGDILRAMETAATVEPSMSAPYDAGIQRHRAGMRATVERLAELGSLRSDVGVDRGSALMDVLLAPSSWRTLTLTHGLSFDEAEALLTQSLNALVVQTQSPASGG